jgi:putative signal transducing protein
MKTVFFSNDRTEVEHIGNKLVDLSIPCEIRDGLAGDAAGIEHELWVQRDEDLPRAFMECVRRRIGFAKRKSQLVEKDAGQSFVAACAELMLTQT